jgi:hypothetical protein
MSNHLQQRSINLIPETFITTVAADAVYTIKPLDNYILISSTAAVKAITLPVTTSIQRVTISMAANAGGSYTAAVVEGTLTFDAIDETATIISVPTVGSTTWRVESLRGATIV